MASVSEMIAERECGDCTACCKFAPIIHERLHKPTNLLCPHCSHGCMVYETRPDVCRDWNCGWKILSSIPRDWRPDCSGLVFRVEDLRESEITVTILDESGALQSDMFAELIDEWVAEGIRVFFQTVGSPGYYPTDVFVNPLVRGVTGPPAMLRLAFNEMLAALAANHEWERDGIELQSSILDL